MALPDPYLGKVCERMWGILVQYWSSKSPIYVTFSMNDLEQKLSKVDIQDTILPEIDQ